MVGIPFTLTVVATDGNVNIPGLTLLLQGLGSQFTVQAATATSGSCAELSPGTTYSCALGAFVPGDIATMTFTLDPESTGAFELTTLETGGGAGPYGTLSGTVNPATANLWVHVPAIVLRPRLKGTVRLGIVVGNNGPLSTPETLSIVLPALVRFVAASPASASCSGKPLVCSLGESAPQATQLVVVRVRAVKAGSGTIQVTVSGTVPNGEPAGATGSVPVSVAPIAASGSKR
jgi:hypothetical protein